MLEKIKFVEEDFNGEMIRVTTLFHVRKIVNITNGKDVLTSNFYYDIINEKPYLSGEEFVIRNVSSQYPQSYKRACESMTEKGIMKRSTDTFLTEAGVLNILYVYGIDPKTLLKGGERIPMKQERLFTNPPKPANLSDIFNSKSGLVSTKYENEGERIENNFRVYVRDFESSDETVIVGLNHHLSRRLSTSFKLLEMNIHKVEGTTPLTAQIYLSEDYKPDKIALIIRFVLPGKEDSITMRRSLVKKQMTNIALRKTSDAESIMQALKNAGIQKMATKDIEIDEDMQTVIAYFQRRWHNGRKDKKEDSM